MLGLKEQETKIATFSVDGKPVLRIGENLFFDPATKAVVTTDGVIRDRILSAENTRINGHPHGPLNLHIAKDVLVDSNEEMDRLNEKGDAVMILPLVGKDVAVPTWPRWEEDYFTKITGRAREAGVLRKGDFTAEKITEQVIRSLRSKEETGEETDVKAIQLSSCPYLFDHLNHEERQLVTDMTVGRFQPDEGSISTYLLWFGETSDFLSLGQLPRCTILKKAGQDTLEPPVDVYIDRR